MGAHEDTPAATTAHGAALAPRQQSSYGWMAAPMSPREGA